MEYHGEGGADSRYPYANVPLDEKMLPLVKSRTRSSTRNRKIGMQIQCGKRAAENGLVKENVSPPRSSK